MYLVELPSRKSSSRRRIWCESWLKAYQIASDHVRHKGGAVHVYNVHGAAVAAWCSVFTASAAGEVVVRKLDYPRVGVGVGVG